MSVIKQSESTAAYRRLYFRLVDATDGITAETGVTGTGFVSKNGAAAVASTGSITQVDATNMPGVYYIELTAAEVDTLGTVVFRFKSAATAEASVAALVTADGAHAAGATTAEIADAVWDEARSGHTTAGTFGEGAIAYSLAAQAKADVNAEVVDALVTDTYGEPAAVPAATASLKDKINWLFVLARNKITQTATTQAVRNDADAANIATAAVSDDLTTFTRGEFV